MSSEKFYPEFNRLYTSSPFLGDLNNNYQGYTEINQFSCLKKKIFEESMIILYIYEPSTVY